MLKLGPHSYQELVVWQKAMALVDVIYDLAEKLPPRENFGLWSQVTRAAVSVVTNIAEGQPRGTSRDFGHFLTMAHGSLTETETLVLVAIRRRYLTEDEALPALNLASEVGKMLISLRAKIGWTRQDGRGSS